jgi:hypothetical protein
MKERRTRGVALLLVTLLCACGSDGGVGGTGISTISGNVAIGGAAVTRTSADLEGITIGLRGTNLRTVTDTHGDFELEGEFDGEVTVEFTERDGTVNMLPLDVPLGGIVSLRNVRFARGAAMPDSIDLDFEATVVIDAVCDENAGMVQVADRGARPNAFTVDVTGAMYDSDAGCAIADPQCTDLLSRRVVRIVGNPLAGEIHASRVRLISCRAPGTRGR